jgi:hypothetical protein
MSVVVVNPTSQPVPVTGVISNFPVSQNVVVTSVPTTNVVVTNLPSTQNVAVTSAPTTNVVVTNLPASQNVVVTAAPTTNVFQIPPTIATGNSLTYSGTWTVSLTAGSGVQTHLAFSSVMSVAVYNVTLQLTTLTCSTGSAFGSLMFVTSTPGITNAFSSATSETTWGAVASLCSIPLAFSTLSGYSCYGTTNTLMTGQGSSPALWLVLNTTAATSVTFYFAITATHQ